MPWDMTMTCGVRHICFAKGQDFYAGHGGNSPEAPDVWNILE